MKKKYIKDSIKQYIVLDLEWNSVFTKKADGYFNEIIEIGAVKLDKDFKTIDEFSINVHPVFSKKLNKTVKKLTGIVEDDLRDGVPFSKAVSLLRSWINENQSVIITWSDTDVLVFLENFKYFYNINHIPFMFYYADIQEYCQQLLGRDNSQQIALSKAAEVFKVDVDKMETHRALDDSKITAMIFKSVYEKKLFWKHIFKADEKFYDMVTFKNHYIRDINDSRIEKNAFDFDCENCGFKLEKKGNWFMKNNSFFEKLICNSCGDKYYARIQFKVTYDNIAMNRKLSLIEKHEKISNSDNDNEKEQQGQSD